MPAPFAGQSCFSSEMRRPSQNKCKLMRMDPRRDRESPVCKVSESCWGHAAGKITARASPSTAPEFCTSVTGLQIDLLI